MITMMIIIIIMMTITDPYERMFMKFTPVDLSDYKDKLITQQGYICPVTQEYVEPPGVEILFVNGQDYAISLSGVDKLRKKYGQVYINDKIVHAIEKSTEEQVVRDQG